MSYEGHRSRNAWNVSLWIGNDEGLYETAKECIRTMKNRDDAAAAMLEILHDMGITRTPDGSPYTKTSIREAMRGM